MIVVPRRLYRLAMAGGELVHKLLSRSSSNICGFKIHVGEIRRRRRQRTGVWAAIRHVLARNKNGVRNGNAKVVTA